MKELVAMKADNCITSQRLQPTTNCVRGDTSAQIQVTGSQKLWTADVIEDMSDVKVVHDTGRKAEDETTLTGWNHGYCIDRLSWTANRTDISHRSALNAKSARSHLQGLTDAYSAGHTATYKLYALLNFNGPWRLFFLRWIGLRTFPSLKVQFVR